MSKLYRFLHTEIFYGQATGLLSFINGQELFFTHYSFHGLFIGKVTEEWKALQCVFYRMLTLDGIF